MLLAIMGVVAVVVEGSIQAQRGTVRDASSKSALQAAEAGVNDALLRYDTYNSVANPLTAALPCIDSSGNRVVASGGWCSGATISDAASGTATYYVKPTWITSGNNPSAPSTLEIVSVGSSSGITRRIDTIAKSVSGTQPFINAAVLAQNDLNMSGNASIQAPVASGGGIELSNNADQCGVAQVGLGHQLTLANNSAYYTDTACTTPGNATTVTQAPLILPPVSQGDAPSSNDDVRLANAVAGSGTPADLISGNRADVTWNAATRQLTVNHNSALTLTGTKYSFCSVTLLQNSAIYVATGLPSGVKMYFDSPESCGLSSGATQLNLGSNTRISPASGDPSGIAMLFVGSPVIATSVNLSSNSSVSGTGCVQNFVVYAPLSDLTLASNSNVFCGGVAGKTISLRSNSNVVTDAASQGFVLPPGPPHFAVDHFVECTAAAATPPNVGC